MIIENGTIEVKVKTAGGIDIETGHPRKSSNASWGAPIPCQWLPNSHNKQGRIQGEHFTIATYEVLIEEQPFEGEQVRLKDRAGKQLGEFPVISVEPLEAVCQLRILV